MNSREKGKFFRFLNGELPPENVEARILRAGDRGILPRVPDAQKQFRDGVESVPAKEKRDALERVPTNRNQQ